MITFLEQHNSLDATARLATHCACRMDSSVHECGQCAMADGGQERRGSRRQPSSWGARRPTPRHPARECKALPRAPPSPSEWAPISKKAVGGIAMGGDFRVGICREAVVKRGPSKGHLLSGGCVDRRVNTNFHLAHSPEHAARAHRLSGPSLLHPHPPCPTGSRHPRRDLFTWQSSRPAAKTRHEDTSPNRPHP